MYNTRWEMRPVVYGIALYFFLAPLDFYAIGGIGSILRLIALVPLGLQLLEFRNLYLKVNGLLVCMALFWYLALVSIFFSVNPDRSVKSVTTLTMNYLLIVLLGMTRSYNSREISFLQKAMLYGSWLTVFFTVIFSDLSEGGRLSARIGEMTQDQNYINGYFLYAFSYHWDCFFRRRKWMHLVGALVLLGVELLTGSRGALLAFGVCFLFHLFLLLQKSRNPVRNMLIMIAVILALAGSAAFAIQRMPQSVSMRFTLEYLLEKGTIGRAEIWGYLWSRFVDSSGLRMLFGNGYGTTMDVNQMNGMAAHNLYMDNLTTLGILGVSVQVMMQLIVIYWLGKYKQWALLGCYLGMLGMCMSLSLLAYKPIWNVMIMALIVSGKAVQSKNAEVVGKRLVLS